MNQIRKNLKPIIASILLIAVLAVMVIIYTQLKPQGTVGAKEVAIDIVIPDEETKEFTLSTDAEFLRQALQEENLINGTESEYGFFIKEVNGRIANDSNQEWWCITKNDEEILFGVDEIAIKDGDHYEITLTVGY